MFQNTFGYDPEQDRLWLLYNPNRPRIWMTRRIAQGIVGPVSQLIERTTPGGAFAGATPQARAHLEHKLATQETPQGAPAYPFTLTHENHDELHEQGFTLCKSVRTQVEQYGSVMVMTCEDCEIKFEMSRQDLHLWLRAMRMALENTNWNLTSELPEWLTEPILPPAFKAILDKPIPTDLDDPEPDK
jgi:truncated hemoglobin YjbI